MARRNDQSTNRSGSDSELTEQISTGRRRFIQAAGLGAAGLTGFGGLAAAQSDDNVIELEAVNVQAGGGRGRGEFVWEDGEVQGPPDNVCNYEDGNHVWVGVSPNAIDGQTNPTLDLTAGESYTVEWTNTTGEAHNFVIVDADGDELVSTDEVSEEGATQSLEFTASEEMAEYYCAPHSGSQRGEIAVGDGGDPMPTPDEVNLLIVSVTKGYAHRNIPYGIEKLKGLSGRIAEETGADSVNIDTVPEEIPDDVAENPPDDSSAFPTDASELEKYDAIIWFSTTGDVLDDPEQRAAFEEYIQNGGGYAGIHAAGDTHHPGDGEWDFYLGMHGGAYFTGHPENQDAEIHVTDQTHPSTDHLPATWEAYDEWYDYSESPRGDVHVLATLDEDSYEGAEMENGRADHPISWCQEYQGGRVWYTGRGHTEESFDEDAFIDHVLGGILWAGGFEAGDASGTVWDRYAKSEITSDFGEGMKLDTTPDGRLFFTERTSGVVSAYDPDTGEITTALSLDVYSEQEDGLQGIAFDPDFEENGWVYIFYSPTEEDLDDSDEMPYNLLSRFTMEGDAIDPDSETEIIRVHTQRETCCHVGGDIAFGPDGEELYLSTGDDTNPHESSGYSPLDERDGREPYDAQRTAANSNDLRGSILRIIPNDDGSYAIPDGNLFTGDEYADARDQGLVREEIYLLGCRNPFTMDVDENGRLYYADYGPDAGSWNAERGPPGIVEFNVVDEAGFHGWPYFSGSNIPFVDYDFETEESGDPFDPENPINDSPNNTGIEELPPAEPATIYYPYDWDDLRAGSADVPAYAAEYVPEENPWPEIPGGGAPMAGPVIEPDDDFTDSGLPDSYGGKWFIMEWNQGWVKYVSFDEDGDVMEIDPFLPTEDYVGPQDMTVGAEGELYVLEYGAGFFDPSDQGLYVIERTDDGGGDPDPDPDPEPPEAVSVPYGLDSGGESDDQTVTIQDLQFDTLPNESVTQTGEHTTTSLLEADGDYSIEGTDNDLLYKTEHYGQDIGYDVAVPDGTYDVTLHFAEIWWGVEGRGGTDSGEGQRLFDVSIQGETVLSDYDIYAEAGSLTATTETIENVEVTDGVLSISSTTHADNTKFSAIEIRQTGEQDGDAPGLNPAQTIRMDGHREGWEATAPQEIAGETNPTLTLRDGEEYTVTWTNVDGTPHDFVLQDADDERLTGTEIVSDEGATLTLTFTASEEMAEYICTVHPSSMVADVEIVDGSGADVPISTQFWTYNNSDLSVAELIEESDAAGYDAVEPYQLDDVDAIATALEENDVYMSSAHVGIDALEGDSFEDTLSTYIDLGADTLIHAYLGDGTWSDEDAIVEWAERINDVAAATAAEGVSYGYHNHDQEFQEFGDRFGFDIFAENVSDDVHLQLDVGWALVGGADPVSVIERHAEKIDSIHMKDMTADGEFTEIGEGDVDMEAVATAAREEADVDYLIYEYDGAPNPIESMNTGADFLEDING